ncbi:MAG: signal peptidase II [Longimicrobiales bacterium]
MRQKLTLALAVIATIVVADIATKRWALEALSHGSTVHWLGGMPFTLAYNTGIAFGLEVPTAARWVLIVASVVVVIMLGGLFRQARPDDWPRVMSISLVTAGAIGNLVDRVRWGRGVVDFIGPIDLGFMHWPIFNVADMAITVGAISLGLSLWREDAHAKRVAVLEAPEPEPERD